MLSKACFISKVIGASTKPLPLVYQFLCSTLMLSRNPLSMNLVLYNGKLGYRYSLYREFSSNESVSHTQAAFWNMLYDKLKESVPSELSKSNQSLYKEAVIELLHERKRNALTEKDLRELQNQIESLTDPYDERSIYCTVPNLIKKFILRDKPTAKEFLSECKISPDDIQLLKYFDQYTLECLMLNVLAQVFNSQQELPAVRVSTMVEYLERNVKNQDVFLKDRKGSRSKPSNESLMKKEVQSEKKEGTLGRVPDCNGSEVQSKKRKEKPIYAIGTYLVEFLVERELISLTNDFLQDKNLPVKMVKGKPIFEKKMYAMCNFDLSLLPIKLNLPMVCEPLPWKSRVKDKDPLSISDLSGGYLSAPPASFYHGYRLLTTHDINHFYIKLGMDYKQMCSVMTKLQSQAFEINSEALVFIKANRDHLVELGLLMPSFLASLNLKDASDILRMLYYEDDAIKKVSSFPSLLQTLVKRIQSARHELFILTLASAYDGYRFYLPAFLDFRGRIYRAGILHFHEGDLARSLIVFARNSKDKDEERIDDDSLAVLNSSAAFHYKSFVSLEDSRQWYDDNRSKFNASEDCLIEFAQKAKHPFQFIATALSLEWENTNPKTIPVTQDASSSAYQIMSYLLLDEHLATQTNLIPSDGQIHDFYSILLEELVPFLKENLDPTISGIVCDRQTLTRKLVKSIFMPLIYGKTVIAIAGDMNSAFSPFLNRKECYKVASLCYEFWLKKFPNMVNLMRLIRNIGGISSSLNKPIRYHIPFFTTVQDYMLTEPVHLWLYDRILKKRRRLTLRIPTQIRDRRKTEVSTFVNFIHQKDAFLAMSVVTRMNEIGAPVYTVHDNFLTAAPYARKLPDIYSEAFMKLGSPLSIINTLILLNIFAHENHNFGDESINHEWDHFLIKPIEQDLLRNRLYKCIPECNNQERATWEGRISVILSAYETYVRNVCGSKEDGGSVDHLKRWDHFLSGMGSNDKQRNYCLHH